MKKWTCPLGRMNDENNQKKIEYPDRTAYKAGEGIFDEYTYQVWPNRASMAKSIRIQEKAGSRNKWKSIFPLRETEGY
jgi:hypothetical protein